jgi:hypothetical protein
VNNVTSKIVLGLLAGVFSTSLAWSADSDFLAQQQISFTDKAPDTVLVKLTDDLKAVFERYHVALDSGSKIVSPLKVGGSRTNPTLQVSIEKCVVFICKTVDLDAEAMWKEIKGTCQHTYALRVDLTRSSKDLSDVYDRIDGKICYNSNGTKATFDLQAAAHHAPTYQQGMIQGQVFNLLKLQVAPIVKAINDTIKANASI